MPGHGDAPLTVYSSTPCFVRELNVFVSEEKRWVLILIDLGGKTRPSLIPFIEKASYKVNELISGFYALW